MSNTVSQSQALGNLSKLLENKQIDQNMHDYLVTKLTTPILVEYDPENPDHITQTRVAELTNEEKEQIDKKHRSESMSSSVIQFTADSLTKDNFIKCLIGVKKSFEYALDFSTGDQKIEMTKIDWGLSFEQYDTWPKPEMRGKQNTTLTLRFVNKQHDGVIQAEIVE